jgi:hypothetical protein
VQLDLEGNTVASAEPLSGNLPSKGRLAVMAATGTDIRLLIMILIAMELPTQSILGAVGC